MWPQSNRFHDNTGQTNYRKAISNFLLCRRRKRNEQELALLSRDGAAEEKSIHRDDRMPP